MKEYLHKIYSRIIKLLNKTKYCEQFNQIVDTNPTKVSNWLCANKHYKILNKINKLRTKIYFDCDWSPVYFYMPKNGVYVKWEIKNSEWNINFV